MTSRDKFEAWWSGPRLQETFAERTFKALAWDAWQASRYEEIELSGKCECGNNICIAGNRKISQWHDAIRAVGFKVKGG